MQFFLDSANLDEIKELYELGLIDGVTTNPSLIAKSGHNFHLLIKEISSIISGPISAEVTSNEFEQMQDEAFQLARISPNIVVKLPINLAGLKLCKILTKKQIKTNLTLCFSPLQALLAAKSGATYVSPFIGRLDDIGHDGVELIENIITIYRNYNFTTKILAASIRHPNHLLRVAKAGSNVATMPANIIKQLVNHPLTDIGIEQFMSDFNKS